MSITKKLIRIDYSDIYTLTANPTAFFFEAGMMIDADGAYHAYHPKPGVGLDYLANAGQLGDWWALVTDNGLPGGNPIVQGATDPAPGYFISTTSLEDTSKKRTDPRRYVDAESIPFFVLPGKPKLGASLGDFGIAVNPSNRKACGCIFADTGPKNKIGEGSIALAKALGIPSSPKHGGVAHGIVYLVFPGSKTTWPLTAAQIDTEAQRLFTAWGGITQLQTALPAVTWFPLPWPP
jgi:hypothetical protein